MVKDSKFCVMCILLPFFLKSMRRVVLCFESELISTQQFGFRRLPENRREVGRLQDHIPWPQENTEHSPPHCKGLKHPLGRANKDSHGGRGLHRLALT